MEFPVVKEATMKQLRNWHKDIEKNQHIFYRPSDNDYEGYEDHPLFQLTNIKNTNGAKYESQ